MSTAHSQENQTIVVGSKNRIKVSAVQEVVADYPCFKGMEVVGAAVESSVKDQPLTLEETVKGAKSRAAAAYLLGDFGVGLESGLMEVPLSDGEYMDVCVCSVYDGERHHLGMSCGFRLPREVVSYMLEEGVDLNQAMIRAGFTENERLGASEGSVGFFTGGRIVRKDYSKQCLITALISIEKSDCFRSSKKTVEGAQ